VELISAPSFFCFWKLAEYLQIWYDNSNVSQGWQRGYCWLFGGQDDRGIPKNAFSLIMAEPFYANRIVICSTGKKTFLNM